MSKPWIDIGTMSIARKMVPEIHTFLDHFEDRHDFRLRWIYHLDTYPWPGLEDHFGATLKQALDIQERFDDTIIIASWSHSGFGGSLLRVLREVQHDWWMSIEDDHRWIKSFRVSDMIARNEDYVNFKGTPIGSISPSLWSRRLVDYLLANYPEIPQHVTARDLMRICRVGNFKWTEYTGKQRNGMRHVHFEHPGDARLAEFGVRKLGPLRYYFDAKTGNRVKVKA